MPDFFSSVFGEAQTQIVRKTKFSDSLILIYFFSAALDFISVLARTGRKTPILKLPYSAIYGIAPVSIVLIQLYLSLSARVF